jgi:molybdopterin-guanine dinucleotide biosynthesis protein A
MGEDKGLRHFLGRPLIARVVERTQQSDSFEESNCILIANRPDTYASLNLPMWPDETPGLGPMGGLFTALTHCHTPLLALVACDMPFVNAALLAHQCHIAQSEACDAVVPLSRYGLEPLHAVYRVDACLPVVREAIAAKDLAMMRLLLRLHVREVDARDDALTFMNVNTPEDWREAERVATQ